MPDIEDDIDVDIKPDDIRIDTYRSSGAGGQHINKTSSAIRITHFPTGIVVTCQNERSQFQTKDKAMQMLKSKLLMLAMEENQGKLDEIFASDAAVDMIVVMPTFQQGADYTAELEALVANVESKYPVIPDSRYRAILGVTDIRARSSSSICRAYSSWVTMSSNMRITRRTRFSSSRWSLPPMITPEYGVSEISFRRITMRDPLMDSPQADLNILPVRRNRHPDSS